MFRILMAGILLQHGILTRVVYYMTIKCCVCHPCGAILKVLSHTQTPVV